MTLVYRYDGKRPGFYASARCQRANKPFITYFFVDTGACYSCVPAIHTASWGHDNAHSDVKQKEIVGIGGCSKGYVHSFRFGLIDSLKPPYPTTNPPIWEASVSEILFVNELKFGLLGMDVMSEWKQLVITPNATRGGTIQITTS